jgi:hypothetical protein
VSDLRLTHWARKDEKLTTCGLNAYAISEKKLTEEKKDATCPICSGRENKEKPSEGVRPA